MSDLVLIEFEDQNGKKTSDKLQVPINILKTQLQSLVNTTQSLYVNGELITNNLEETLKMQNIANTEEVIVISMKEDEPATQAAMYCSSSFSGHEGPVLCAKKSNKVIVTGGGDKTVRFWDSITKTQSKVISRHDHWVLIVEISPDEKYVASGSVDGGVNLYSSDGNYIRSFNGHKKAIVGINFQNNNIITASRDKSVIVWSLSGEILFSYSHSSPVTALAVKENTIISGDKDGKIKIYKNLKFIDELKGHGSSINSIVIHNDTFVSGCDGGHVIVWKNNSIYKRMSHNGEVISLSISKDGKYIASGSFDKSVRIWNFNSGELIFKYLHVDMVYKVLMMNDLVVSSSKDKTIKLYRISKKKKISEFVCSSEVYCFDFDTGCLVAGTKDNRVYFFN